MTDAVRHRATLIVTLAAVLLALVVAPRTAALQTSSTTPSAGQVVYWCPMHPDVRGKEGDKCPLCGMALIRAAAADYAAYVLDVETVPRALKPLQKGRARFFVRDPRTLATVKRCASAGTRFGANTSAV